GPESPAFPVRALVLVLHWSPVWVPLLLIWQITLGGLRPALSEQQRLSEERPAVEERHAASEASFLRMAAERRAWEDPAYRERLRRLGR
ncbi:MAG: hypothetical protein VXZ39_10080, partial [Planctomycetota bacterium]|nr:hypothetical protein [Planctomycetota bacterium]